MLLNAYALGLGATDAAIFEDALEDLTFKGWQEKRQ
jgi:hypothetical protein